MILAHHLWLKLPTSAFLNLVEKTVLEDHVRLKLKAVVIGGFRKVTNCLDYDRCLVSLDKL